MTLRLMQAAVTTVALTTIIGAVPAFAGEPSAAGEEQSATAAAASSSAATQDDDSDRDPNFAQPDFNLAALPTSLRLPRYKSAFRVTHRFGRPLGDGTFGSLAEDLFGLDAGGVIGLEYRFSPLRGSQLGIHRTSDRTIQFFGQYDIRPQRDGFPLGITALASVDGTNNFKDSYSPALGVILSREIGERAAVYVEPVWVNNTNELPSELVDDNNTVVLGLGARVRVRPTVYLLLEAVPRLTGYDPGSSHISFGVEKRAGGHLFQLNFSNGLGTTLAQIARGGLNNDDWFIGFNISRKFY